MMIEFIVRTKRKVKNRKGKEKITFIDASGRVPTPGSLLDFLRTLPLAYPRKFHELAYLGRLYRDMDTPIIATRLENVIADLQELLLLLEDPSLDLDIPSTLSAEYLDETWEFGRDGLVRWATDLLALAEQARSLGKNGALFAWGD